MGWTKEEKDGYILVKQENGAELGYSPQSGARLIEQDGFLFKDLAGGGQLLPYLDWRLSYEERAAVWLPDSLLSRLRGLCSTATIRQYLPPPTMSRSIMANPILPGRPILGILQTTRGALLQRIICAISLLP